MARKTFDLTGLFFGVKVFHLTLVERSGQGESHSDSKTFIYIPFLFLLQFVHLRQGTFSTPFCKGVYAVDLCGGLCYDRGMIEQEYERELNDSD